MGLFSTQETTAGETPSGLKRLVVLGIAIGVTASTLVLAVYLGALGYEIRWKSMHESRLQRLLERQPTLAQVREALQNEGTRLIATADVPQDLPRIVSNVPGQQKPEIHDKGARWPVVRVFLAGEMAYFVYFDKDHVMRGFTCVSRR